MLKKTVLMYSRRETDHWLVDPLLPNEEIERALGADMRKKGGQLKVLRPKLFSSDIDLLVATNPQQFKEALNRYAHIDAFIFYRLIYIEGEVPDSITTKKVFSLFQKENVGVDGLLAQALEQCPKSPMVIFRYGQMPSCNHFDRAIADFYDRLVKGLEEIRKKKSNVTVLPCESFEKIIDKGFAWFERVFEGDS